jgi:uncharacterized membrane protein
MPDETMTIKDEQAIQLKQSQIAAERAAGEAGRAKKGKPKEEHFINSGEAILLLAATGSLEIIQWLLDLIPYVGWIVNGGISILVAMTLFIWLTGKVAQGAPKSWYKVIWLGAFGGALPVIPGQLGAIIYLLIQDRKLLGKIGGKLGEEAEKLAQKAI